MTARFFFGVIPAHAGLQKAPDSVCTLLGSRFRGSDEPLIALGLFRHSRADVLDGFVALLLAMTAKASSRAQRSDPRR